ncbi:MAG: hypothetical protein ACRDZ3_23645 [Acidimicrobiia bacterium]
MSNRGRTPGRASGRPAAPGNRQQFKLAAAIGLPLVVAVALIGLVGANSDDDPVVATTTTTLAETSPEARAFQTRVEDALRSFAQGTPAVITAAAGWIDGSQPADALTGQLNVFFPQVTAARQAVAAIPPLEEAPLARDLYREAISLYIEFGRIYLTATDPGSEPLRAQLDLAARRVRSLADKIYDQGLALVDPASQSAGNESVEIRRGPEVPDWDAEGLSAGPPLAGDPPPPPEVPPAREPERPQEQPAKWLERVREAEFPSGAELAEAIASLDGTRLAGLTEVYLASVAALRVAPDPESGRVRGAVAALSYLVSAESARVAQAASLVPAGPPRDQLIAVARRLALIGENLLEPELRDQPTGIDPAILDDPAP